MELENNKPIRHNEITEWVDYIMKRYNSDNYKMGVCKEFLFSYFTEQTVSINKHDLKKILLEDVYDVSYFYYPPIIDLLFFDSVLLFGHKHGNVIFERVVDSFTRSQNQDTLNNFPLISELEKLEKDKPGLIHTVYNKQLIKTLWSASDVERLVFCLTIINEMHNTANFLLKKKERTVNDITEVIGPRLSTHQKYLLERTERTKGIFSVKKRMLFEETTK